jgi:uncharacterized protein (DUF736 family)
MSTFKEANTEVGAAWLNDKGSLTLRLKVNTTLGQSIFLYKNKFKTEDNQPDYRAYVKTGTALPTSELNPTDDPAPF